jgi:hypothetical protein
VAASPFAIRDEINADDDDEPQRALDWPCEQNDTRADCPAVSRTASLAARTAPILEPKGFKEATNTR